MNLSFFARRPATQISNLLLLGVMQLNLGTVIRFHNIDYANYGSTFSHTVRATLTLLTRRNPASPAPAPNTPTTRHAALQADPPGSLAHHTSGTRCGRQHSPTGAGWWKCLTPATCARTAARFAFSPFRPAKSAFQTLWVTATPYLKPCFSWSGLFLFKTRRIEVAKSVALLLH